MMDVTQTLIYRWGASGPVELDELLQGFRNLAKVGKVVSLDGLRGQTLHGDLVLALQDGLRDGGGGVLESRSK